MLLEVAPETEQGISNIFSELLFSASYSLLFYRANWSTEISDEIIGQPSQGLNGT